MPNENNAPTREKRLTLLLPTATYDWLTVRAKDNGRARCREVLAILNAERAKKAEGGAR